MNKYGAKKTTGADGRKYASRLEAKRAYELQLMEKDGEIWDLEYQKVFPIEINDTPICKYIADFSYLKRGENGWIHVVEDAKGVRTQVFNLKAKMFKAYYGFDITIYPQKKRGRYARKN